MIWNMRNIHIVSVSAPFDIAQLARQAVRVISMAEAMGLLDNLDITELNAAVLEQVVDCLAEVGIGQEARAELAASKEQIDYGRLLGRLDQALELSPVPSREWHALANLFEVDHLASLLRIASASVRRYRSGERPTPDDVAARLHYLAAVVGDLAGAYNDYGIRRWFCRPRAQLDGKAPADLLADNWDPADPGAQRVRELANALTGSGAT